MWVSSYISRERASIISPGHNCTEHTNEHNYPGSALTPENSPHYTLIICLIFNNCLPLLSSALSLFVRLILINTVSECQAMLAASAGIHELTELRLRFDVMYCLRCGAGESLISFVFLTLSNHTFIYVFLSICSGIM